MGYCFGNTLSWIPLESASSGAVRTQSSFLGAITDGSAAAFANVPDAYMIADAAKYPRWPACACTFKTRAFEICD